MNLIKIKPIILATLPLVIAVLIMTPRLTSAQFGLLDDGYILNEVREILSGDLSMGNDLVAGRFRPMYWLYFTVIYALACPNPVWFFVGHLIVLMILLIELRSILKHQQLEDWQILVTSLLFLFSVPIIENFYTLSKGETLQLVFILASLLCLEKLKGSQTTHASLFYTLAAFLSILSAIWAKETSYVMLPVVALWAGYVLYRRNAIPKKERHAYLIFLGTTLGAIGIYFLLRSMWGATPASGGTYTGRYALSVLSFITRAPRWMTLYAFYFPYLLPLSVIAVVLLVKKELKAPKLIHNLFNWGIWSLAWSTAFVPWEYAEVYYLLPFSLGTSILAGILAPHIRHPIRHGNRSITSVMAAMVVLFCMLWMVSLTHYRTHARVQLTFDRLNDQMLRTIKQVLPEDGELIFGMNRFNEYVQNTGHFLIDQDGLTSITYDFVSLEILLGLQARSDAILVMPYIDNQPGLLLRAGVEEEFTMAWVDEIHQTMKGQLFPLEQMRAGFQINNINLPVLACPLIGQRGFCENPDPLFDTRFFNFGWDFYRIQ